MQDGTVAQSAVAEVVTPPVVDTKTAVESKPAAQEPAVDASKEAAATKDKKLSDAWVSIAKQEKRLREQKQAFDSEHAEKLKALESISTENKRWEALAARIKANPFQTLDELVEQKVLPENAHEEWTKRRQGLANRDPEVLALRQRTEALEKQVNDERIAASQKAIQEQADAYESEIMKLISSDEFKLCEEFDAKDDILEVSGLYYQKYHKLPDPKEIVAKTNDECMARLKRLHGSEYVKKKLASLQEELKKDDKPAEEKVDEKTAAKAVPKTITSDMKGVNNLSQPERRKTRDELIAEGVQMLRSKKK